jgi:hypothetical protein
MSYTHEDYVELRRRVEERFNKRTEWFMHATAYLIGLLTTLVALNVLDIDFGIDAIYIWGGMAFWGAIMVMHGVEVFFETYIWVQARERAIQREIEVELWHREGRVPSFIEKPKRMPQPVTFSDEGELIVDEVENFEDVRTSYHT